MTTPNPRPKIPDLPEEQVYVGSKSARYPHQHAGEMGKHGIAICPECAPRPCEHRKGKEDNCYKLFHEKICLDLKLNV